MLKGFRAFILRGNVVDLAVAFILGGAFAQVIQSLVADVLTPLIGALGGRPDLSAWRVGPVAFGKFINAALNFLLVAAVLYFLIVAPLEAQKRPAKKVEEASALPSESSEEARLLREILETLRSRP